MGTAVGDSDLMSRFAEMTNSYWADEPGPANEHDAHRIILSGTLRGRRERWSSVFGDVVEKVGEWARHGEHRPVPSRKVIELPVAAGEGRGAGVALRDELA